MVNYYINEGKTAYKSLDAARKRAYSMVSGRSRYVKIAKELEYPTRYAKVAYIGQVSRHPYDGQHILWVKYGILDEETEAWYLNKDGSVGPRSSTF